MANLKITSIKYGKIKDKFYQIWQIVYQMIQLLAVIETDVTFAQKPLNLFPDHSFVDLEIDFISLMSETLK